jgi:hypothetical protein
MACPNYDHLQHTYVFVVCALTSKTQVHSFFLTVFIFNDTSLTESQNGLVGLSSTSRDERGLPPVVRRVLVPVVATVPTVSMMLTHQGRIGYLTLLLLLRQALLMLMVGVPSLDGLEHAGVRRGDGGALGAGGRRPYSLVTDGGSTSVLLSLVARVDVVFWRLG